MRRVERYTENKTYYQGIDVPEIGSVHERNKKAGIHAVGWGTRLDRLIAYLTASTATGHSLGQPQEVTPAMSWTSHGADKKPFATFKFRYRPLGAFHEL